MTTLKKRQSSKQSALQKGFSSFFTTKIPAATQTELIMKVSTTFCTIMYSADAPGFKINGTDAIKETSVAILFKEPQTSIGTELKM